MIEALLMIGLLLGHESPPETVVEICQPSLPSVLVDGRANLVFIASFEVDSGGSPHDIQMLATRADVDLADCLQNWRLPHVAPGTEGRVVLEWVHARGWSRLHFDVGTTRQTIYLNRGPAGLD